MRITISGQTDKKLHNIEYIINDIINRYTGQQASVHVNYDNAKTPEFITNFPVKHARESARNFQRNT